MKSSDKAERPAFVGFSERKVRQIGMRFGFNQDLRLGELKPSQEGMKPRFTGRLDAGAQLRQRFRPPTHPTQQFDLCLTKRQFVPRLALQLGLIRFEYCFSGA